MNAPTPIATIASRLKQYLCDIEALISNPSQFLNNKNANGQNVIVDATIFLALSATLSAILEEPPGTPKQPLDLWDYSWGSFRSHVFPALLFAYLQAIVVLITMRSWHNFFSVYASTLGILLVVRGMAITIVWDSAGRSTPLQDFIVSVVFLVLLTAAVTWKLPNKSKLVCVVVISTVLNGYVVGMFERAVRTESGSGFFEAVLLTSRYAVQLVRGPSSQAPSQLQATEPNRGRLDTSDNLVDGKYRDEWTLTTSNDNTSVVIDVESNRFDTFLLLLDSNDEVIDEDDDSGGGPDDAFITTNSRIEATLSEAGDYSVIVTSFRTNSTGAYTVTLSVMTP